MDLTRRGFMTSAALGLAAGGASLPAGAQFARTLLKGGCVLSFDPRVGDFDTADVLIENRTIAAVRPNITADAQLVGVDLARIRRDAQASRDDIAQRAGWPASRLGRS